METFGILKLFLILNSTVNKHHIRRVMLFKSYGTKHEAADRMHEFCQANGHVVSHVPTELVWQPEVERLELADLRGWRSKAK